MPFQDYGYKPSGITRPRARPKPKATSSSYYSGNEFGSGNIFTETSPGASTVNFGNNNNNNDNNSYQAPSLVQAPTPTVTAPAAPTPAQIEAERQDRIAKVFEAAGATLPEDKGRMGRVGRGIDLYSRDIFTTPFVATPDNTQEITDYLQRTAVDDALRDALGMPEVYQGTPTQEEPEPNIDMSVLQGALQPEPITVEELPDVTVKAGDTLSAIAEANNLPVQDVIDANPQIANPDMIRPGQKVTLPTNKPLTQQEMLEVNTPLGDTKVVAANVDFDFIKEREGYEKKMYVPKSKGKVLGKSGPTIASGFDLGQRNEADLDGLPPALVDKLKPYLGKKGASADAYVKSNPLTLSTKEADQINKFAKKQEVDRLKDDWESASDVAFEDLTKEQATVVASVAFQYGDLPTKAPTFWRHVTNGDWDKAEAELRSFGDKYTTRRVAEADYLAGN